MNDETRSTEALNRTPEYIRAPVSDFDLRASLGIWVFRHLRNPSNCPVSFLTTAGFFPATLTVSVGSALWS